MRLLQCGFIASGASQHKNSKDICRCTPVPVGCSEYTEPCPGGWGFALALEQNGDLYCWGVNQPTMLQKKDSEDGGSNPSLLERVSSSVRTAAAGFDHGLIVKTDGKVLAFGSELRDPRGSSPGLYLTPLLIKLPVRAVAAGEHHSLIMDENGGVWAMGSNREGQIGDPSVQGEAGAPVLLLGPGSNQRDSGLQQPAIGIAAGARHSVVVNSLGQCITWGWSLYGQCGSGRSLPSVTTPTVIKSLAPLQCTSVGAGMAHTVVCTVEGGVYCWGGNEKGQLGDGGEDAVFQPKLVESALLDNEDVVKVACGARHTLALTRSGKAFGWGHNQFGALGVGTFLPCCSPVAVAVPDGRRVVDMAAGWWHSLFMVE